MNITLIIIIGMLVLSILAPFVAIYAISFIKKKEYAKHAKIQKRLFWVCVAGVLILELRIRMSGGSGSLVMDSKYIDTTFFKYILAAHIIGAVLTYIVWAINIFWSSRKFNKKHTLPGISTKAHKILGLFTVLGLFFTAITALIVCIMAFFL